METLTQGLLSLMLHCTGRLLADPHLQGGVMKWSMSTGVRSGGRPRAPTLCYPRSSSFHFLNVSKNARVVSIFSNHVAVLFTFIHESFPKNRREKRWVPFFNCMHEAFPFRHWSSRRGRIDGAVARSSVSRSSAGFLEVAVEGGRIPLPLALHWVS